MKRAWLLFGYSLFVVYGSLVPFDFSPLPLAQAWERFQHIPFLQLGLDSRADWVANGVLYAPLGLLAARVLFERGLAQPIAVALALLLGGTLAVGVEFTQLFFPPRTVSQNDLIAEAIGTALGAVSAPFLAAWIDRLTHAWSAGGSRLVLRLLEAYTLGYVLLCFFPYDLLLSLEELRGKLGSGEWGWLLADIGRGRLYALLRLAVESALCMPIGALLALRAQPRMSTAGAAFIGALLGLLIEVGQFFVASGVSQGASVLSRALGVSAGAALWPALQASGTGGVRGRLRRVAPWLWAVYLPLLLAVNGTFSHAWQGLNQAAAVWDTVRVMPFYYHYFTSEAAALFSLGGVALMYLPVAVLAWARGWPARVTLLFVGCLAALVETGKLFVAGQHPDPTNVLIAVGVDALALCLLAMAQRDASERTHTPANGATPLTAGAQVGPHHAARPSAWLCVLPAVAWCALGFPIWPTALLLGLAACAAAVWRWPVLALALLPAALPVLDLAPWSGRFFWDEFDLLCATCLAVAFHRSSGTGSGVGGGAARERPRVRGLTLAFILLGLSLAASSVRALWPLAWPDDNSFNSYFSAFNALRIVKGAVWAWLFVGLWQRLATSGNDHRARSFEAGMLIGLTLTVAVVLWERAAFVGLWDFAADFRVTGAISAMHKGGAYIECWLVVATAFAMSWALRTQRIGSRVLATVLLVLASYSTMVTYSRNGYAALAAVLLVSLVCVLARPSRTWRRVAMAATGISLMAAVAVPIVGGSYAQQRLAQSGQEWAVRQAHWADGLALRDDSALTTTIGMGIGRFPQAHFWRSREAAHAASYQLERKGEGKGKSDQRFLRLGMGATLYIDQVIAVPATGPLRLSLDLRVPVPSSTAADSSSIAPTLVVNICEKWILSSRRCVDATVRGTAPANAQGGSWQHVERGVDLSALQTDGGLWRLPVKLTLLTPAQGVVDVTHIRLSTVDGVDLVHNGDFAQGLDRWFFATDIDPPWHLHSLPVAVLFDQGWLGVLAWAAVVCIALASGVRHVGHAQVPAALAAVVGFLVSASVNTLIDAPRFLWLLLVLLWLAAQREHGPGQRVPASLQGSIGATAK